ncbi:MAG: hypothetical protein C3F12_00670 [Candidatus Methylomirabilota bacterium]|nr:DUF4398 domain-containing protein [Candidatus Methylomirabilis sp.]NJD68492.1 hypothetical protein [candidate division NC10 bacterium]PWB48793.1 MAG: hypothetical protein C3F12_00670 [candidate division NC10 bacterium]
MSEGRRSIRCVIVAVMIALVMLMSGRSPSTWLRAGVADAQELVFMKALEDAEKAIREARDYEAEIYAPEEFSLALEYLAQAKDEAKLFRAATQEKGGHLFSARTSGEAVSLLAEKAQYQAKVAGTKAIEVKATDEITTIKALITDTFNTTVDRRFTPTRERLFGELSTKEAVRSEARKARAQAESELRRLTLEGQTTPAPQ